MKDEKEILQDVENNPNRVQLWILKVLLDIRNLLAKKK